jgi:hypothetical protein
MSEAISVETVEEYEKFEPDENISEEADEIFEEVFANFDFSTLDKIANNTLGRINDTGKGAIDVVENLSCDTIDVVAKASKGIIKTVSNFGKGAFNTVCMGYSYKEYKDIQRLR